jgi:chemotaxis protein MotB
MDDTRVFSIGGLLRTLFEILLLTALCLLIISDADAVKNTVSIPRGIRVEYQSDNTNDRISKLADELSHMKIAYGAEIEAFGDNLILRLPADGMFRESRAEIKSESKDMLEYAAHVLKLNMPQKIRVEAHTDAANTDTPQYPSSWYLSAARAINVARFLMDETGQEQIFAEGKGSFAPLYTKDNKKNNRIEIIISP